MTSLLLPSLSSAGGDEVNNGGGLAEKNVLFARENLSWYVNFCLQTNSCRLTEREYKLLLKLKNAHAVEIAKGTIEFISEQDHPGTFLIDGQPRLAKTGSAIGSPILVNRDLMYLKELRRDKSSEAKPLITPLSLGSAVAMLVHEFGHHHGEQDHLALDVLGSKVQLQFEMQMQRISMFGQHRDFAVLLVDTGGFVSFHQLLMTDGFTLQDRSAWLRQKLACPDPAETLSGLNIWNAHWTGTERYGYVALKAEIQRTCRDHLGQDRLLAGHAIVIEIPVEYRAGRPRLAERPPILSITNSDF